MVALSCCFAQAFSSCSEGGYSLLWCFSLWWLLLLWIMGLRHTGSLAVAPWLNCSVACGIFLDRGLIPCPLFWQVDSCPLSHYSLEISNHGLCPQDPQV